MRKLYIKAFCISNKKKLIIQLPSGEKLTLNHIDGYKRGDTITIERSGRKISVITPETPGVFIEETDIQPKENHTAPTEDIELDVPNLTKKPVKVWFEEP